ncbi:hypothetical protein AAC387_Pa07g1886 [Persea americana]
MTALLLSHSTRVLIKFWEFIKNVQVERKYTRRKSWTSHQGTHRQTIVNNLVLEWFDFAHSISMSSDLHKKCKQKSCTFYSLIGQNSCTSITSYKTHKEEGINHLVDRLLAPLSSAPTWDYSRGNPHLGLAML